MAFATIGTRGIQAQSIDLTTKVTGTLPVPNGGLGVASGTTGQFLKFTGTETLASAAVDPSGMTLIFDQDTSDVAEIEKTSAFSSTYDYYLLTYTTIRATADSADKVLLGNSGGYTTSYAYGYRGVKSNSGITKCIFCHPQVAFRTHVTAVITQTYFKCFATHTKCVT